MKTATHQNSHLHLQPTTEYLTTMSHSITYKINLS